MLINLIGNAIKFTEQGEVIVRVERDPEHAAAGALRFAVRDTGIGVPEESRELIFAPYSQVDTSTMSKFGGSGLGLAISREVVELMQGRIWAESSVGAGSTFYFTARFAVGGKPPLRALSGLMDLKDVKTLVIDDNTDEPADPQGDALALGRRGDGSGRGRGGALGAARGHSRPLSLMPSCCWTAACP